jgi:HSP20 family protein
VADRVLPAACHLTTASPDGTDDAMAPGAAGEEAPHPPRNIVTRRIDMRYRNQMPVPMVTLGRELDRFMDETFGRLAQGANLPTGWTPAMDVSEDEQGLLLELEVPGLAAEDVEVTTDQGLLTVKGEKTASRQREGVRSIVTERTHGRFVRTLRLPQGVDESKVEAEFTDGLLRIRVPRAALPQARKVDVRRVTEQPRQERVEATSGEAAEN